MRGIAGGEDDNPVSRLDQGQEQHSQGFVDAAGRQQALWRDGLISLDDPVEQFQLGVAPWIGQRRFVEMLRRARLQRQKFTLG